MRKITLMIFSFVIWFLLVWPFDPVSGNLELQSVIAGAVVAIFVGLLLGDKIAKNLPFSRIFSRIFWLLVYIPMFIWYVVVANLDVVYRVVHPDMPIRPGIVKVKTTLTNPAGRTMLANSITLTPGTLTVEIADEYLYIHWINVQSEDIEGATQKIVSKFEGMLRRIFE
ncbi:MAG: Na+/H+ antiporter subunit E [bacterium]